LSRFYIRRGLKIWPAFYTLIAAGLLYEVVMPGQHFTTRGLLPELLFVQDYVYGIWGITWSLAVEEHFYLLLPLVLLLMIRRDRDKPFAAMPYFFAAIAIFSLACRFAVGWRVVANSGPFTWLFPTHLRMDGLMFGVLLCYYRNFHPSVFQRIASWRGNWAVIAAAVALLSVFPVENRNMHTWGLTAIYLAAGLLVAKAVVHEGPRPIRDDEQASGPHRHLFVFDLSLANILAVARGSAFSHYVPDAAVLVLFRRIDPVRHCRREDCRDPHDPVPGSGVSIRS
jgi:peptidoglycan/LPS O-acetylase OafA/YrhL